MNPNNVRMYKLSATYNRIPNGDAFAPRLCSYPSTAQMSACAVLHMIKTGVRPVRSVHADSSQACRVCRGYQPPHSLALMTTPPATGAYSWSMSPQESKNFCTAACMQAAAFASDVVVQSNTSVKSSLRELALEPSSAAPREAVLLQLRLI